MNDTKSSDGNLTLTVVLITIIVSLLLVVGVLLVGSKNTGNGEANDKTKAEALVGKPAPNFELEDLNGNKVSLDNLKGKNVVLFFSEGLMCYPACWDQMAKLGSDARLNNDTTVAYSIILDPKSEWQKAFDKMPELRSTKVLFDNYGVASKTYNTLELDSSMHRGSIPGHTYFIVDKNGVVRYFYDDPQMGIRNDLIYEQLKKL